MKNKTKSKLEQALLEKALGYKTEEITEEYGLSGDDLVLTKRKTSTKSYPPDMSAIEMLLENAGGMNEYENMSDEDLEKEKNRLIKLLEEKK